MTKATPLDFPTAILTRLLQARLPHTLKPLVRERVRRNIRAKFIDFCEYALALQDKKPAAHHRLLCDKLQMVAEGKINRLMIFMPPGSAKALTLDTPIPTPSGWTTMGELRVGDQVFDENGKPCNVTWKSPVWKNRPVYNVMTDCGDVIVADKDHEWLVRLCGKKRKSLKNNELGRHAIFGRDDEMSRFKIKETHELTGKRSKRPMIKRAKSLQLPDQKLPLDPYLLGLWLGDGSSESGMITSHTDDQSFIRNEIHKAGYDTTDRSVEFNFGILDIRSRLADLGLLNSPHKGVDGRKHIPEIYLRASEAQRLSLLQGLIDTDGTICRTRGCATFCSANLELALNVRELVRSLGRKAGWSEGRAIVNGKDCGPYYRVSFYHAEAARLPRKRELCRDQVRTPNTYIDVDFSGYADTVCIEVDSPSHLFLCGKSMTPTHNSTYATIMFPVWLMMNLGKSEQNPEGIKIIGASHTADLAESFSKKVQKQVIDASEFTDYNVATAAAHLWETTNGCEYKSAGVNGPITGHRADCLKEGTMVTTPIGDVPIEDVAIGTKTGYVLSYDENTKMPVFRRVVAKLRRETTEIWRIRTESGRLVEATGNHRFYVGGRWATAASISVGDVLLRDMRRDFGKANIRNSETPESTAILQSFLPYSGNKFAKRNFRESLPQLRRFDARNCADESCVFGRMSLSGSQAARGSFHEADAGTPMLDVQNNVYSKTKRRHGAILWKEMREYCALIKDDGKKQSWLAEWNDYIAGAASFRKRIYACENRCSGERQIQVRSVRIDRKFAGSPHQYESIGQQNEKLGNYVCEMSKSFARSGEIEIENDTVSMVERVCESAAVYDIQVEETECFFANGILVHNCGIIDDPVKSRADAESPTFRQKTYDWYKADFLTRLKPRAPVILIQTRWHEEDLAGQLLRDEGEDWEVLSLPAIAGTYDEATGRWVRGDTPDPLGRLPGEFLWGDDEYGYAEDIKNKMRRAGPKDYWSLYMQSPRPLTGGIFKTNNITILDALPAGRMLSVRAWDLAGTEQVGNSNPDATAGVLMFRDRENRFYIADIQTLKGGPDEVEKLILSTASRDSRLVPVSLPQDPGQAGKAQVLYLTRKLAGYKVHTSPESGDKATRASPLAAQINVGNVYLIRAEWNAKFINELKNFSGKGGGHDDMVDASSRAFNYLMSHVASERFEALAS